MIERNGAYRPSTTEEVIKPGVNPNLEGDKVRAVRPDKPIRVRVEDSFAAAQYFKSYKVETGPEFCDPKFVSRRNRNGYHPAFGRR